MKSVIVTGASSGIGKTAAVALARAGYRIIGLARRYDKLAELSTLLSADQYVPIVFDATKPEKFSTIVNEIAGMGQIFGLVNNAGYVEPGAIEDITMADLRVQFETNFFGLVGLTKQVLPAMMQHGEGRIVNVSSMAGLVSLPLIGAYCASKYAVEAVTDALRMELWNTGIKVISINPGIIETGVQTIISSKIERLKDSRFASAYKKYLRNPPQGLPATKVADAIVQAIGSKEPKPRYLIGSRREKAGLTLRRFVPDGIFYSQVARRV